MSSKTNNDLQAYIERINDLVERKKISYTKRNKLLMKSSELPTDFIDRQLKESQYIAKKAKEMLQSVCHNVYSTSGSITDFIRHIWGWDEVLHTLNFNRYREAGLTEYVEREIDGKKLMVERIAGWTKRMDHRHHAIDALTIACTKQGYIQRINNLNSLKEIAFTSASSTKQDNDTKQRLTKLQRYIRMQPHFSTAQVEQAVNQIAISFKGGKRVATTGKRYIYKGGKRMLAQQDIIIPRGALHKDYVYGRIKNQETGKYDYVLKYKVGQIVIKDLKYVVDKRIREILRERLEQFGGDSKKAFAEPIFDHQGREIRSVRCSTGLSALEPLRYNKNNEPIAFVNTANNHHVAIYEDESGTWQEHIVTLWHAVERKKYGVPVIIHDTAELWENITKQMPQAFLNQLPESAKWQLKLTMQQNEMFILGMEEELYQDAMKNNDYATLSKYLYRVQNISAGAYVFRKHIETQTNDNYPDENGKLKFNLIKSRQKEAVHWIKSLGALKNINPHKVRISLTGKISEI